MVHKEEREREEKQNDYYCYYCQTPSRHRASVVIVVTACLRE